MTISCFLLQNIPKLRAFQKIIFADEFVCMLVVKHIYNTKCNVHADALTQNYVKTIHRVWQRFLLNSKMVLSESAHRIQIY